MPSRDLRTATYRRPSTFNGELTEMPARTTDSAIVQLEQMRQG